MNTKEVKKKYNRFSLIYNLVEWPIEKLLFHRWRKNLLDKIEGKVLEIGIGTGKNLPYYNFRKVELVGIDISNKMLEKAQRKVGKNRKKIKLQLIDSERLPFKNDSFDYIVNTFLLCSVPNQEKMLKEMRRVVKKKGKIIMLEHVLSKNKWVAFFEHLHNPLTRFLFGINVNRDTMRNIERSGLRVVKEQNLAFYDVFKELRVRK